jgi:hypothetical protein
LTEINSTVIIRLTGEEAGIPREGVTKILTKSSPGLSIVLQRKSNKKRQAQGGNKNLNKNPLGVKYCLDKSAGILKACALIFFERYARTGSCSRKNWEGKERGLECSGCGITRKRPSGL